MDIDSRQYIRHPMAIPIHVASESVQEYQHHQIKDVSEGGLCFSCANHFNMGDKVQITISICHPDFDAEGIVRWCKQNENDYLIGIVFLEKDVFLPCVWLNRFVILKIIGKRCSNKLELK